MLIFEHAVVHGVMEMNMVVKYVYQSLVIAKTVTLLAIISTCQAFNTY